MPTVTVNLSQTVQHPPLDLLTAKHHVADITGQGTIAQSALLPGFGIQWGVLLAGVEFGYTLGYLNTYEARLAQLVLEWDIGSSGAKAYQVEECWNDRGFFWYQEQLPARMAFYCAPSVTLELNRVSFL